MSEILLDNRDIPLDGATIIEGAPEVAQNIGESIATPYGSLPWDREAGSHLFEMLNDLEDPPAVVAEIRRVALETPGLFPSSVAVGYDPRTNRYRAQFVPLVGRELSVVELPSPIPVPLSGIRLLLVGANRYLLAAGRPLEV